MHWSRNGSTKKKKKSEINSSIQNQFLDRTKSPKKGSSINSLRRKCFIDFKWFIIPRGGGGVKTHRFTNTASAYRSMGELSCQSEELVTVALGGEGAEPVSNVT